MDEQDIELGCLRYVVRFLWPVGTVCAFVSCILYILDGMLCDALLMGGITAMMVYVWIDDEKGR